MSASVAGEQTGKRPSAAPPSSSSSSAIADLRTIDVLACILQSIAQRNDAMHNQRHAETVFSSLKRPPISIADYLHRIVRYVHHSTEVFILSLIYLDRLISKNESFAITSLNIHRLLITSVMVAAKFFEDTFFTNSFYAKVGGVSVSEMNLLELEFLYLIRFSLHVTPDCFERYGRELRLHSESVSPARPCLCLTLSAAGSVHTASSSGSASVDSIDNFTSALAIQSPPATSASLSRPSSAISSASASSSSSVSSSAYPSPSVREAPSASVSPAPRPASASSTQYHQSELQPQPYVAYPHPHPHQYHQQMALYQQQQQQIQMQQQLQQQLQQQPHHQQAQYFAYPSSFPAQQAGAPQMVHPVPRHPVPHQQFGPVIAAVSQSAAFPSSQPSMYHGHYHPEQPVAGASSHYM